MKFLLSFCAVICISVFAHAQTAKYDSINTVKSNRIPDKLKVSLSNDKLFIVYKNQEIPAASILVLDSLVKKVPGKDQLVVEFENINAEAGTVKSIDVILKKCQCNVSKRSVKKLLQ
jgi:hypothetical protein